MDREYEIMAIMDRLESIWRKHPDLRLGQLIGIVYDYALPLLPDEALISGLEAHYAKS